ncbi:hypothetical protein NA57DRAFT_56982 [Rhizodiscina lignyota]|uniref:Uncharacterized protein n=1 Tax=Rhizodiscina lignyota TaxID=1504668 RepID=A0A9P4IBP0_9PEZI|nr:hypothetical protein NA57DRAFT_56982 [Rhizodiscina lignyota]
MVKWWVPLTNDPLPPATGHFQPPFATRSSGRNVVRARNMIDDMQPFVKFGFDANLDKRVFGVTRSYVAPTPGPVYPPHFPVTTNRLVSIKMHIAFLDFSRKVIRQRRLILNGEVEISPEHEQRVQFLFAVTIAHELVHALFMLRSGQVDHQYVEPYYANGDTYQDLGFAFEAHALSFAPQYIDLNDVRERHGHLRDRNEQYLLFWAFCRSSFPCAS